MCVAGFASQILIDSWLILRDPESVQDGVDKGVRKMIEQNRATGRLRKANMGSKYGVILGQKSKNIESKSCMVKRIEEG